MRWWDGFRFAFTCLRTKVIDFHCYSLKSEGSGSKKRCKGKRARTREEGSMATWERQDFSASHVKQTGSEVEIPTSQSVRAASMLFCPTSLQGVSLSFSGGVKSAGKTKAPTLRKSLLEACVLCKALYGWQGILEAYVCFSDNSQRRSLFRGKMLCSDGVAFAD